MPKVDAAEVLGEENRQDNEVENTEQDFQKKKKKKQKIGFRDRKVH